jgi:hypothetical protein
MPVGGRRITWAAVAVIGVLAAVAGGGLGFWIGLQNRTDAAAKPTVTTSTVTVTAKAATSPPPPQPGVSTTAGSAAPGRQAPLTFPGNEIVRVNIDVQPGTYTSGPTPGSKSVCRWTRRSDTGTAPDGVIEFGGGAVPQYVVIADTDVVFTSDGCDKWTATK